MKSPIACDEIEREFQRRSFERWLPAVTPLWTWDWPYQRYVYRWLEQVTDGSVKRLMLFMPPRHTKSETVTVRYPVWRLERTPDMRCIIAAYNQILANKFSRKARRIAQARIDLSAERIAVEDWETAKNGGIRAIGVGGGITGQGANLIIIDDPVKNRDEAESQTYRDRCYDWYTDDLYTRLEPGGAIVLIQTRWHEDDLAGRILASEDGPNWKVISLPAEAEPGDPLGRAVGEALCPERYPVAELRKIRTVLGTYAYTALYQQHPMPPEGGMFQRQWFDGVLEAAPAEFEAVVRYWDKAATEGGGDYSAGALVGRKGGVFVVVDVKRGQWSSLERERIILQTAQEDRERYRRVAVWLEQEPGSSGVDSAQATIRALAGFTVHAERASGEKAVRAMPFAAQCEAGNVKLVRGPWNAGFLDELCSFPHGTHDDQVDSASGAFNRVAVPENKVQMSKTNPFYS